MRKHKGGFAAPIGEVADAAADAVKGLFSEVGQTVRGHQDNKTKCHVSDNDSGVRHHEIDSTDLGKRFDFVIRGFDTLIHGIDTIGRTVNESRQIKADLERVRSSFETARDQLAMNYENSQKTYQTAMSNFQKVWNELFAYVQSNRSISEKERESYLAQMSDTQKHIKEITISFLEREPIK